MGCCFGNEVDWRENWEKCFGDVEWSEWSRFLQIPRNEKDVCM